MRDDRDCSVTHSRESGKDGSLEAGDDTSDIKTEEHADGVEEHQLSNMLADLGKRPIRQDTAAVGNHAQAKKRCSCNRSSNGEVVDALVRQNRACCRMSKIYKTLCEDNQAKEGSDLETE